MDPQLLEWQRQAQEAVKANPEKKDAIEARLEELYNTLPVRWAEQGQKAMDGFKTNSADEADEQRAKIQQRFKSLLTEHGFAREDGEEIDVSTLFKQNPAEQFKDVEAGVKSVRDEAKQVEEDRKNMTPLERIGRDYASIYTKAGSKLLEGAGAVAGIAGGVADAVYPNMGMADQGFKAQEKLNEAAQYVDEATPDNASPIAKGTGDIAGHLATFPVQGFMKGQDVVDKGGSIWEGQGEIAKQLVKDELSLGAGLLGPAGMTGKAILGRTVLQTPASIGVGKLIAESEGREYTTNDLMLDTAFGVGGGVFPNAAEKPGPIKSIEDIDVLAKNYEKVLKGREDAVKQADIAKTLEGASYDAGKIDLSQSFNAKFPQIKREAPDYGATPKTEVNVEGQPVAGVPEAPRVVDNAAFPQQEGVAVSVADAPTPFKPVVGDEITLANKVQKVKEGDYGYGSTTAMGESPIKTPPIVKERKPHITIESLEEKSARIKRDLEEGNVDGTIDLMSLADTKGHIASARAPAWIVDKLSAGTLTARDVLKVTSQADAAQHPLVQQAAKLTNYLQGLMETIGGGDVKVLRFDPDNIPAHAAMRKEGGSFAAFYDHGTNAVYIKEGREVNTILLHEVAHGITSKMLDMGSRGQLGKVAQEAFADLDGVFEQIIKPKMLEMAGPKPGEAASGAAKNAHHAVTYGLKNMKEFYAEFFSNGVFRNALKELKLDPALVKALPSEARGLLWHAKSVYDLAVGGISKLMAKAGINSKAELGMAEKATNAYELMFKQMDELHNRIDDRAVRLLKKGSEKNTAKAAQTPPKSPWPDNMVAQRKLDGLETPSKAEKPVKPQHPKVTKLKAALSGTGPNKKIGERKELLAGAKQEIRSKAVALANKVADAFSGANPAARQEIYNNLADFLSDSSLKTVTSAAALDNLMRLDPKLGKLAKEMTDARARNAVNLHDAIVEAQKLRKTPSKKALGIANKIIDDAYSYDPRFYASKEATQDKWKLAAKAMEKEEAGKLLSKREQSALSDQRRLLRWTGDYVFGGVNTLKKLSNDSLRKLYTERFSQDDYAKLGAMADADKKKYMVTAIAEANDKLANRSEAINEYAAKIAGMGNTNDVVSKYYASLQHSSDVLSVKEDIPAPIRKFWGEIHDPAVKLVKGLARQEGQLAEVRSLTKLREEGLGTLFTTEEGKGHTVKLRGDKYGALEDLHTTPDIKSLIDNVVEMRPDRTTFEVVTDMAPLLAGPLKAIRFAKQAKTVYRPDAWIRNGIGSAAQMLSNGNLNPKHGLEGIKAMRQLFDLSHKREVGELAARMQRLGLVEASQITDVYSADAKLAFDNLLDIVGETADKPITMSRKVASALGRIDKGLKEGYGAMDLWTKFANFFHEVDVQKAYNEARGIKMSDEALDEMVANRIKQTNITPSRSPAIVHGPESVGGTTYMSYYYETGRTSVNNILTGMADMRKGMQDMRAGHKEAGRMMVMHGAKRVVGTVGAVGMTSQAYMLGFKLAATALGINASVAGDNKELKKYMEEDGFQDPDSTLVFKDDKTGKDYGLDAGGINPYQPVFDIIKPLATIINDPENADEHIRKSGETAIDLISRSSVIVGMLKAARGSTPSMKKTDPEMYEALYASSVDAGVSPEWTDKAINALAPVVPGIGLDEAKRAYMDASPQTKHATRLGARSLDPAKDIQNYLGGSFNRELSSIKDSYSSYLKGPTEVPLERLDKSFVNAMKDVAKPYRKLEQSVKASYSMGRTEDEVYDRLKNARVDEDAINAILDGEANPAMIVFTNLESEAQRQIDAEPDEAKKEKLEEMWDRKLDQLDSLLGKYEDISLEQLEQGELDGK